MFCLGTYCVHLSAAFQNGAGLLWVPVHWGRREPFKWDLKKNTFPNQIKDPDWDPLMTGTLKRRLNATESLIFEQKVKHFHLCHSLFHILLVCMSLTVNACSILCVPPPSPRSSNLNLCLCLSALLTSSLTPPVPSHRCTSSSNSNFPHF